MKVIINPKRPISGILPKNKWIDSKIELDLNKNEIKHCMQYGSVHDMSGILIDEKYITNLHMNGLEVVCKEKTVDLSIIPMVVTENEPIIIDIKNKTDIKTTEDVESEPMETIVEESPYFNLEMVSCVKEDEYIILEIKMDTNSKLEGNLYGLFTIVSGPRPSAIEYKVNDNWIRFSNKFADLETVENNDRFVFRFIPKNENEFTYRVSIKTGNDVLAKFENSLKPSEL